MTGALEDLGLTARGRIASDVPKITSDWLRSYREADPVKRLSNEVYYAWHHSLIEALWADDMVVWLVATSPHHPHFIAGWLCGEMTNLDVIVHYLYVRRSLGVGEDKTPARRIGLGTLLLNTFMQGTRHQHGYVTHMTRDGAAFLSGRMCGKPGQKGNPGDPRFEYNPYLAWRYLGRT